MPNTLTHSLSPQSSPFSLCSFVFGKKLQHIVVFNIYKGRFLLFLEKKTVGTHEILLCPFACD